jgi:hypothetical protein
MPNRSESIQKFCKEKIISIVQSSKPKGSLSQIFNFFQKDKIKVRIIPSKIVEFCLLLGTFEIWEAKVLLSIADLSQII